MVDCILIEFIKMMFECMVNSYLLMYYVFLYI